MPRVKKPELIGQLNSLGIDVMARFEWLNYGGCAVYAALVGRELLRMGVKVRVLVAGNTYRAKPDVDKARPLVKNPGRKAQWVQNGVNFGHVGLEIIHADVKYHYDSYGATKPKRKLDGVPIAKGRMTLEECELIAKESDGWNDQFNRRQIPALRRMVKKHFAEMNI